MRLHFYVFAALALLFALPARATHIVGGELGMQYQTGDLYRLTLTLYFDAINGNVGALDPDATAGIFEQGTNRRIRNITLPLTQNTFVPYTNIACTIGSLSTRQLVYTAALELPANVYNNPRGYYVAVERCCRNNSISNIVGPGNAGQVYYLEFPAVVRNNQAFRDSSPRIFPPLSDYACLNELFYFDFGGTDSDGDSLAYEMSTPLNGNANSLDPRPSQPSAQPYSLITWNAGLSQSAQMPGAPTLSVDGRSGRLTVRPTRLGLFVFGVKCSEFRRGIKIGEVRRDFQLLVINCPTNRTPEMVVVPPGPGRAAYVPGRDTMRIRSGQDRCLRLRFTDPDPASQLQMELRPVNFTAQLPTPSVRSGGVRMPGQPDTITSTLCFPECFSTQGRVYLLDVIVADNGCSLPRRDTVRVAFTAEAPPNSLPQVSLIAPPTQFPIAARVGTLVQQDVLGLDVDNDAMTLELTGRGFSPAAVGAQLVTLTNANGRITARLTWQVDCRAVDRQLYEFEIRAAANPCQLRQTSLPVVIPVRVDYQNQAPALTSSFPADTAVVKMRLGDRYVAQLKGLDGDLDGMTWAVVDDGVPLAATGMSFRVADNRAGETNAVFEWVADCGAVEGKQLEVGANAFVRNLTFELRDVTCRPVPRFRTVRFEIIRPEAPEFLPPNIFTPNKDGRNEAFQLTTLPPDFCTQRFADITIFNRWGSKVYRSTDRNFRWDGAGVVTGVYYYLVKFTDGRTFKGTVTVAP
ncbi:gliding motility-associated C-terminal domain-containing protein [Hymenobacter koreensis]|uniref:Gliding motility-associated C-terminal domain-containing protein n=1 Tax=Hymenobacter koreensis TaxID=1084523 RepID=A0ABP8J8P6_9BACT